MDDDLPPGWGEDACVVCPARHGLAPGEFDVVDDPSRDFALNRELGWRVDARTGAAVCIHPYRVGLPPGRYASGEESVPGTAQAQPAPSAAVLELPEDVIDLEGWFVAVLRTVAAEELLEAISQAEQAALTRFAVDVVTEALRRVLSRELARRDEDRGEPASR